MPARRKRRRVSRLAAVFGDDADVLESTSFRLLLLASLCSPLGGSLISPVIETLAGPYGVSVARVSLLMSVYTAPSIVVIPVVGALSDRYGRRPLLVAGLTLLGLAGLVLPLTTDFRVALALRALQGVGYCGIGPVLITSIGDLFDGDREATAQGIRFTAVSVGLAGFPLLAGSLAGISWRTPLYLFGAALPVAGAVAVFLDEPTAVTGPRTDGGEEDPTADSADGTPDEGMRRREVLTDPGLAALIVARGTPTLLWFSYLGYASVVAVRVLDGTPETAGALVAVTSVAAGVGSTQVGRLSAFGGSRFLPMLASLLVAAAGLALVAVAPSVPVAGVGAVIFGGTFSVLVSLYRSTITTRSPESVRGTAVSLGESAGRLGGTIGPVLTGGVIAATTVRLGEIGAVRAGLLVTIVVATVLSLAALLVAARAGVLEESAAV